VQVVDTWESLKTSEPGSLSGRVAAASQTIMDRTTPEERLMQSIPSNASKAGTHLTAREFAFPGSTAWHSKCPSNVADVLVMHVVG
jgi:hypothetical protein